MKSGLDADILVSTQGDAPAAASTGTKQFSYNGKWRGQRGIQAGTFPVATVDMGKAIQAGDRRRVLAIAGTATFQRYGTGGFGWAGGNPTDNIELDDLDYIPSSLTTAATYVVGGMLVLTDKMDSLQAWNLIASVAGSYVIYEGEDLDEFRVWNP